ncbi:MAG: glycosyltransferase family 4 protein [Bacteroidota bacterium]
MNILFSLTNLTIGGAQMFVLNLAREFSKDPNHKIYIYDHQPEYSNKALYSYAGENVSILSYGGKLKRFVVLKWNGFIKRLGIKTDYRDRINKRVFKRILSKYDIQVVNSQMSASDFICGEILPKSIKLVITLHGEFELYIKGDVPEIKKKIESLLNRRPHVIYTADKNRSIIQDQLTKNSIDPLKIYIGICPENFRIIPVTRNDIGIGEDDFVIGMIARGIPEKGWEFLISLFFRLERAETKKIHLILIGDGEYLKKLVQDNLHPQIHLLQFGQNYQDYFSYYPLMNLFVFPTFFNGESVPTVIAESLYWKIPVIANDTAEISRMIQSENGQAGKAIQIDEKEKMIDAYIESIQECIQNIDLLKEWKNNCSLAFEKFKIENIKSSYERVFEK